MSTKANKISTRLKPGKHVDSDFIVHRIQWLSVLCYNANELSRMCNQETKTDKES